MNKNNLATKNTTDFTVLEDGQAFISRNKAAQLLGVSKQALGQKVLALHPNLQSNQQLTADIFQFVVQHYAMHSKAANPKAKTLYIHLANGGNIDTFKYKAPRKPINTNGFVYLIQSGDSEWFKIGKAKNVKSRMNACQTGNPVKLNLIHFYKVGNYSQEEFRLHNMFKDCRGIGEWFKLDNTSLTYIKSL